MSLRFLLIAEEAAGIQILRFIAASGHKIVAVAAAPPHPASKSFPNVWEVSNALGLQTWDAHVVRTEDFADRVQNEATDIILNVHSLHILPAAVLRAARIGAFNLHPAALPRYAGLNAVSWAIYHGEKDHGVTLHWMEPEVDAGPIAYQKQFPILPTDSAFTLASRCTHEGMLLLRRLVETAATSSAEIPKIPQDLSQRKYFGRGAPEGGSASWIWPARRIVDFVRACDFFPLPSPWGHPRAILWNKYFQLGKASLTGERSEGAPGAVRYRDGELHVAAIDAWVRIDKLVLNERLVRPSELRPYSLSSVEHHASLR